MQTPDTLHPPAGHPLPPEASAPVVRPPASPASASADAASNQSACRTRQAFPNPLPNAASCSDADHPETRIASLGNAPENPMPAPPPPMDESPSGDSHQPPPPPMRPKPPPRTTRNDPHALPSTPASSSLPPPTKRPRHDNTSPGTKPSHTAKSAAQTIHDPPPPHAAAPAAPLPSSHTPSRLGSNPPCPTKAHSHESHNQQHLPSTVPIGSRPPAHRRLISLRMSLKEDLAHGMVGSIRVKVLHDIATRPIRR